MTDWTLRVSLADVIENYEGDVEEFIDDHRGAASISMINGMLVRKEEVDMAVHGSDLATRLEEYLVDHASSIQDEWDSHDGETVIYEPLTHTFLITLHNCYNDDEYGEFDSDDEDDDSDYAEPFHGTVTPADSLWPRVS